MSGKTRLFPSLPAGMGAERLLGQSQPPIRGEISSVEKNLGIFLHSEPGSSRVPAARRSVIELLSYPTLRAVLQSRFRDKPVKFQVICHKSGTAVLERFTQNTLSRFQEGVCSFTLNR